MPTCSMRREVEASRPRTAGRWRSPTPEGDAVDPGQPAQRLGDGDELRRQVDALDRARRSAPRACGRCRRCRSRCRARRCRGRSPSGSSSASVACQPPTCIESKRLRSSCRGAVAVEAAAVDEAEDALEHPAAAVVGGDGAPRARRSSRPRRSGAEQRAPEVAEDVAADLAGLRDRVGPDQRAGDVGALEPQRRIVATPAAMKTIERSGPKKWPTKTAPGPQCAKAALLRSDRVRVLVERPDVQHRRPEAPAEPPGEGRADQRARARRRARSGRAAGCRWRPGRRPRRGSPSRGSGSTGRRASRRRRRRRRGQGAQRALALTKSTMWPSIASTGSLRACCTREVAGPPPPRKPPAPRAFTAAPSARRGCPSPRRGPRRPRSPSGRRRRRAVAAGPDPGQAGAARPGHRDLAAPRRRVPPGRSPSRWPIAVSTWSAASVKVSPVRAPSAGDRRTRPRRRRRCRRSGPARRRRRCARRRWRRAPARSRWRSSAARLAAVDDGDLLGAELLRLHAGVDRGHAAADHHDAPADRQRGEVVGLAQLGDEVDRRPDAVPWPPRRPRARRTPPRPTPRNTASNSARSVVEGHVAAEPRAGAERDAADAEQPVDLGLGEAVRPSCRRRCRTR